MGGKKFKPGFSHKKFRSGSFSFLKPKIVTGMENSMHGSVTGLAEMSPAKRAEMEKLYGKGPTTPTAIATCTCPPRHRNPPHTCLPGCPARNRTEWEEE